jgi:hypothetical protein
MLDYRGALECYALDLGEYPPGPTTEDLMRSLSEPVEASDGRRFGPYIPVRSPAKESVDRWGTPMRYTRGRDGQGYELRSAGPDKKFGTDDDIFVESHKPEKGEAGSER